MGIHAPTVQQMWHRVIAGLPFFFTPRVGVKKHMRAVLVLFPLGNASLLSCLISPVSNFFKEGASETRSYTSDNLPSSQLLQVKCSFILAVHERYMSVHTGVCLS